MIYVKNIDGIDRKVIITPQHVAFLKLWVNNANPVLIGATLGIDFAEQCQIPIKLSFDLKMNNDQIKAWFIEETNKLQV